LFVVDSEEHEEDDARADMVDDSNDVAADNDADVDDGNAGNEESKSGLTTSDVTAVETGFAGISTCFNFGITNVEEETEEGKDDDVDEGK
jgi:hypothetical protein